MFSKIKSLFALGDKPSRVPDDTVVSKMSEWATQQGLSFSSRQGGRGYQLEGKIGGKPWRMERGNPSRDFIQGEELRARAELDVRDVAVMIITRKLKNDLDKRAFAIYTDSLQTQVDPSLPEEMRWLAMYQEVTWEGWGKAFAHHYAVLADVRDSATAWINHELANSMTAWPNMDPAVPKILMLLRGKAYLRMQYTQDDMPTLEHATAVFTTACELALSSLPEVV